MLKDGKFTHIYFANMHELTHTCVTTVTCTHNFLNFINTCLVPLQTSLKGEAAKSDEVRALEEKLQDRDEELKMLRQQAVGSLVSVQTSLKYDELPPGTDPMVEIATLKQALESKDRKIESLQVQVRSFEDVIKHTKEQSKQVFKLKQELKTVQVSCNSIACCPYRLTCH